MKKLFIAILAALTLSISGAVAQDAPFPDIPANHWALDAVAEIADLGIVIGFPDGTYRGNESFTRYQAALVVSRLLDVVNDNIAAAQAMTDEDIASLRNALQELASDLASQGVRLSAAESAIASISDDVTSNTARIDDLEDRLAGMEGVAPDVLRDLQNQIASQRVAIDTALARAEAAEARANEAFDLANQALAAARENADQISAINSLLQLLGNDLEALKNRVDNLPAPTGQVAGLDELRSQVQRNTNDIANIREFVILLRRDQVALRDRVSALEASDSEQSASISDLQARVTALEENPLGFTGTIDIDYNVVRVSPIAGFDAFDVDRAFGAGLDRERLSFFTTGEAVKDEGDNERKADFTDNVEGEVDVTPTLDFSWDSSFDETGPLGVESFSAVIKFAFTFDTVNTPTGTIDRFLLGLDEIRVNYDPIGADPITFEYGEDIHHSFTNYVIDTDEVNHEDGFVLTVGAPDFLSFLNPTLALLYTTDDSDNTDSYLRGVRATVSPIQGVTAGFSGAQRATNAGEHGDVAGDNNLTTILGGDLQASLGFLSLSAEYAQSSTNGADNGSILFAIVEINPGEAGIPILNSLEANYRDIDENWFTNLDGLNTADDEEFQQDQAGFAVMAELNLFILDVSGFFDSYSTVAAGGTTTAYGVEALADLPLGFTLEAFYSMVSFGGTTVDSAASLVDGNETLLNAANTNRDDNDYETQFGVALAHDGSADNALISGLNIDASYTQSEADFSKTTIEANASYDLTVSIVSLSPYVGYRSINDVDAGATNSTRIKAGTSLETEPINMIFRPSLAANVNYRTTTYTGGANFTADLLQFSVGLTLEEFLFANSSLSVDYGSYSGTNIQPGSNAALGVNDVNSGLSVSVSGYEVLWNYFGLEFGYGVFVENADTSTSDSNVAQAFSISYTVNF